MKKLFQTLQLLQLTFTASVLTLFSKNSITQADKIEELSFHIYKALLNKSKNKPITWLREMIALSTQKSKEQEKIKFESVNYGGVNARWCHPKTKANSTQQGIIVYFHGGGYVFGDLNQYSNLASALAIRTELSVLLVDYRLAPEHTFPAAQQDCLAITQAVHQAFPDSPIILAGDSAGGGLSLNTALNWPTQNNPVRACMLISPYVDPFNDYDSFTHHAATDILDSTLKNKWLDLAKLHTNDPTHQTQFIDSDLSTLPTIYIQAASNEVLLGQIQTFTEQAKQQKVNIECDIYPGLFHDFQLLHPNSKRATEAVDKLALKITESLSKR